MDWAAIVVSVVALCLSVYTFVDAREAARRQLFLSLHEHLLDPDLHRGRRILMERLDTVESIRELRRESEDDYFLVNRALAMLDVVAGYAERGYVPQALVLDEWSEVYFLVGPRARLFAQVRAAELGTQQIPWKHLHRLSEQARATT